MSQRLCSISFLTWGPPSPEKCVRNDPGTEFHIAPATFQGPPQWKLLEAMRVTHTSLSAPLPQTSQIWVLYQPIILKPSHRTIPKAATPFPFPGGDSKGSETPVGLCIAERTMLNVCTLQFPPFQVDPAPSWNNFPSFFQSFHGLFHWLGQSQHPPCAKPGFTYVKTAPIKIGGFFSEFLSLFWGEQRKDA